MVLEPPAQRDVTMTGFRDDDAIPTWAKSYAAAGVRRDPAWKAHGERGGILLRGPISYSEAATVLNRVFLGT